jgi:hypothetical protein
MRVLLDISPRLVDVLHSYEPAPTRRVTTNTTGVLT